MKFFTLLLFIICTPVFAGDVKSVKHSPFFLIGDGEISLAPAGGASQKIRFAHADGSLDDAAFARIDRLFGFPTAEKGENVSRRTIAMLDYFSDLVAPGKTIFLKSGYRSKSSNDALRRAGKTAGKTSTHIDGMALDFYIPGVDGKSLWELIRHRDCCGAGNYGGNVVHLDSGRPRFWEKATSKVHTGASDFNRYIYLSTDYDYNAAQSEIRLFFTSISDFGFGVKKTITYVSDKEGQSKITTGIIEKIGQSPKAADNECTMINDRRDARFIYTHLPEKLPQGKRVRIKIDFCNKTAEEMPDFAVSGEFEVR